MATGIAVVSLLEFGIESSDKFSPISAFLLFPLIFLAGLPWNLRIGEHGKDIVVIGGVGIGATIRHQETTVGSSLAWTERAP